MSGSSRSKTREIINIRNCDQSRIWSVFDLNKIVQIYAHLKDHDSIMVKGKSWLTSFKLEWLLMSSRKC